MITFTAIREIVAKAWIYLCYLIYPTVILLICLFKILPNSILINISPSLLKKTEPASLWINMLGFTSVALITFSTISLLGMIGWLIAKGPSLTREMTIIILVFGGCALLIIFGFFLLLAGIGALMILYAFFLPLIFPIVRFVINKSSFKEKVNLINSNK